MGFTSAQINATGASVISGLTLVAAAYLFYSLLRQGRGKLRVRLLLGMVVSDMMLGCIALPPEILYLAGDPLKTGSAGCNGLAFILTSTLFSQHLWTLAIAFATYLLLTHPLSRVTSMFERYSWVVAPLIWIISIIHSAIWHGTVGWVNNGSLCYYGTKGRGLDRDLIQFIPRAIVFIVIIVLYSRLFKFLRRPDTIQLSTQFMAGTQPDVSGQAGNEVNHPNMANKILRPFKMNRASSGNKDPVNPEAPWEALEFVTVGGAYNGKVPTSTPLHTSTFDFTPTVPSGILLASRPVSPDLISPGQEVKDPFSSTTTPNRYPSTSSEASGSSTKQTSGTDTYTLDFPPELGGNGTDGESLNDRLGVLDEAHYDRRERRRSSLIESSTGGQSQQEEDQDRRPSGQTLKEFFQEYQVPGLEDIPENRGRGSATGSKGIPQISASAYFNRQASLLMLYFPLAYMLVFSVSLVRLVYDMIYGQPTPVLSIMSSWLVLSVGLIDGLVYGIAELMVKAKVRRKMPEHMHSQG
uniref:G-protein coupled receptors family 1 profile domain-containing protein n=1 Tax=Kwoniella dejecticola CBS 10117 TaxID=1296121 RepID=A0A1A6A9F0_9TREE|nr:uncharacterized protein I303_02696 [Kwoniella dejecticola CBS 10117]OBR86684.1 hypothetical protein I303_02696 [Kwoniella dejecticola CBS 10117]